MPFTTSQYLTRPPAVAGMFYPENPAALRRLLADCLDSGEARLAGTDLAPPPPDTTRRAAAHAYADPLLAVIAPHAGYRFSGPIAGTAFARIRRAIARRGRPYDRVLLVGPAHRLRFAGVASVSHRAFATPLGELPVDVDTLRELEARFSFVEPIDPAHEPEHALEVELPFLQVLTEEPPAIVPLLVSDISAEELAPLFEMFLHESDTLVLISSDLSHFNSDEDAQAIDHATAEAICQRQPHRITSERACGSTAIAALLLALEGRPVHITNPDLRNSGDTAGSREEVVGYGAFIIESE